MNQGSASQGGLGERRWAAVCGRVATAAPVPPQTVVHPHAAAIDVHSDKHMVGVGPDQVEACDACTVDLHAMADSLRQHGVTGMVPELTEV